MKHTKSIALAFIAAIAGFAAIMLMGQSANAATKPEHRPVVRTVTQQHAQPRHITVKHHTVKHHKPRHHKPVRCTKHHSKHGKYAKHCKHGKKYTKRHCHRPPTWQHCKHRKPVHHTHRCGKRHDIPRHVWKAAVR